MAQTNRTFLATTLLTSLLALGFVASSAAFTLDLDDGVTVRIHAGDELAGLIEHDKGARVLSHAALGRVELLDGVDDPRMPRRVESFVPVDPQVVIDALDAMDLRGLDLTVDIFLLPAPPAGVLSSFAVRQCILLAPGYGPLAAETVAELVAHEFGHVLTWAYFDRSADAWDRYMDLRGLDPEHNGPTARHADRAREILAEDLRYLLGGELANHHGGIENASMPLPDAVDGLESFLRGRIQGRPIQGPMLAASAWPNPCNPMTTVELRHDGIDGRHAGDARLQILDLRGRLVRTIRGGQLENNVLRIVWDGRGDDGRRVPTGRYLTRIGWSDLTARGSVTVVR